MGSLPPGRLTFGTIRDSALRKAGNPNLVYDGSVWLSELLYDLYVEREWPFLYTTAVVNLVGPSFALPTDFLKTADDAGFMTQTIDGQSLQLQLFEKDRATFEFTRQNQAAAGGAPRVWTADRSTGTGYVFPDPTGHYVVATLRYKFLPVPETTPPPQTAPTANDALVPTFPYHRYLVQALLVEVLQHEQDPRLDAERAEAEAQLQRIATAAIPLRAAAPTVALDADVFSSVFAGDTKSDSF